MISCLYFFLGTCSSACCQLISKANVHVKLQKSVSMTKPWKNSENKLQKKFWTSCFSGDIAFSFTLYSTILDSLNIWKTINIFFPIQYMINSSIETMITSNSKHETIKQDMHVSWNLDIMIRAKSKRGRELRKSWCISRKIRKLNWNSLQAPLNILLKDQHI